MERLQEKVSHFIFEVVWDDSQLRHSGIGVIELILLLNLLCIFDRELFDENTDKIGVDHGVGDINAEHHYNLALLPGINFDQSERNRRVIPSCEPLVEQNVVI